MVIVANYDAERGHGLLGPQMAATVINERAGWDCRVVGVCRGDDPAALKTALSHWFDTRRPVVAFSSLAGRPDLFRLAADLHRQGVRTLLAGPQAAVDFAGEAGRRRHGHRFQGLHDRFELALQGPAEQLLPWLRDPDGDTWRRRPGFVWRDDDGKIRCVPPAPWDETFLGRVHWGATLLRLRGTRLVPVKITSAQVLQQIGCPYAARPRTVAIDPPAGFEGLPPLSLSMRGCAFCDVAADKGFTGALSAETVRSQIASLPENPDGRKVCFELINENPLPGLPALLEDCHRHGLALSQVNLTLRADWLLRGREALVRALEAAASRQVRILLASVGFESFDDTILGNLNKGLNTETNLAAVRLMRALKSRYPRTLGYLREEGGLHGFIHPTPWDTDTTDTNIRRTAAVYNLHVDILPPHSTPLIIHHAASLGRWARRLESAAGIRFERLGSVIAWWQGHPGNRE